MPRDYPRSQRLEAQLTRELNRLMRDALKDPRVSDANVNEVTVSRDLSHARVYVGVLDIEHGGVDATCALNRAAGFLRAHLGRELHVRKVPELQFVVDDRAARGARLSSLIDRSRRRDKQMSGDDDGARDSETPDGT